MPNKTVTLHKPLIAAILPIYNEVEHIGTMLEVLHRIKCLDEIIIVDDGSSDGTPEKLCQYADLDSRFRFLQHHTNKGKGQAVFTGWHSTEAIYLLLLDADLKDLTPQHVEDLITPVSTHKADMTMGLFWGGRLNTDLSHLFTPWLTGQRCLRAEIMKNVSEEAASGYGFEVALTIAAHQHGYRIRRVIMRGVWHPPSEFHRGLLKGIPWRLRMYGQILHALWVTTSRKKFKVRTFLSTILKP